MKEKNGFTLTEVVLSISLLLLLILLVVPNLVDLGDGSKKKMYQSKVELALSKAYKYGVDNIDSLDSNCSEVTVGELISLGYLSGDDKSRDNLINPITDETMNNLVICVYYENNEVKTKLR